MAFGFLLRRLAIRRAVAPNLFNGAAVALNYQEGRHLLFLCNFSSSASVSSESKESLSQIINREIESAMKEIHFDMEAEKPFGFHFKIEDNPGAKTLSLKRKFRNEQITVIVDMPNITTDVKEGDGDDQDQVSVPLTVIVEKGLSLRLEFGLTAYVDEIVVEYMVTKNLNITNHGVPYEGRDFRDLEENMQKAIFEYLAVRGIGPNVTCFLIAYMMTKGGTEYVQWLKNIRLFCH
ncbi:hypothetical protein QQ045_027747 [Rhodiola kirilowii]